MAEAAKQILKIEGVSKRYGGVQALNRVQFDLNYGEVHALVGENGAGKSTLIKVLGGIVPRDAGRIFFDGREVHFNNPAEAQAAGIAIIHQELSMLPTLTVMENLFMSRMSGRYGLVNWKAMERRAREALALVDLHVDPYALVKDLSISQRQMIEIARALSANARLIVMDEPNSSLSDTETDRLFELIRSLKARGIAIMYVSHKIDEVLAISDRITAFRDGAYVGTITSAGATEDMVINMMVGRELDRRATVDQNTGGEVLLHVRGLTGRAFRDVSFDVRKGEILAFSGLVGAGRSEVLRTIFGAERATSGDIRFEGKPVRFASPTEAIKHGLAMVQEDRKVLSLFMGMQVMHNVSMAQLPFMTRAGNINDRREQRLVQDFVHKLDIRLASIGDAVSSLSGGNQQKTVLARWLATGPKLLILDEPTHGVDVGAKAEIYELIRNLAREGVAIVLISSELPEVLALAHRIVVMHEGRITGVLNHADASEEKLMAYATGVLDDFAPAGATS
ncbi:MAG: sugar ABC transporter ATP-binding protein [Chloroflexi bacterium]|nr:sugar ABC transporter ATP-binding protein [Chloroflexota bacterium]